MSPRDSMRFYRTEKTPEEFAPGKHEQRRYESRHVWHIQNGKYKVQINNFVIFTHTYYANCVRCPNSAFNGQRYTDVEYIALLKTTSLCTFVANKSHRSTEAVF